MAVSAGEDRTVVKIYVCCHKRFAVPAHPMLEPIQVGAALAEQHFPGFAADDTGDNISSRNRSYCELTAQYWAWKNAEADYVGFFHYRRYLYPDPAARRPYRIEARPTEELLARLGYDGFPGLIKGCDLILPKSENMYVSVREHYAAAPFHHGKDLALIERILRERHPDYAEAAEAYLSGSQLYFGNIFIMRQEVFRDYCRWLFPLLEEFDRRSDTSGYSAQEARVDGYLAERLLGVYYVRHRGTLKTMELPRVHFDAMEGGPDWKKRLIARLLPPGTKRRAVVKKWKNS